MSDKKTFVLAHAEARQNAIECVRMAPPGYAVVVQQQTRNLSQNAALWSMLTEVSDQVVWHGRKLEPDCWKHIFSSSLRKQEVVPNLDGTGFVVMGIATSRMTKSEMSDLLELIASFGAQHGVTFKE